MSEFKRHPSPKLNALYYKKSYQGANPNDAKIIFIGKDPNWAIDVEEKPIFTKIEEYLTDGISFWKKYNIHHPFLLSEYRKGEGFKYHNAFSKTNIKNIYADKISFVELIGFPTTGMSGSDNKNFSKYLFSNENRINLFELDKLFNDVDKTIFMAWGLIDYLKSINQKNGLFKKIENIDKKKLNRLDLNQIDNLFIHKHFSMGISINTINKISQKIHEKFSE